MLEGTPVTVGATSAGLATAACGKGPNDILLSGGCNVAEGLVLDGWNYVSSSGTYDATQRCYVHNPSGLGLSVIAYATCLSVP